MRFHVKIIGEIEADDIDECLLRIAKHFIDRQIDFGGQGEFTPETVIEINCRLPSEAVP